MRALPLVLVCACAARGTIKESDPPARSLAAYQTVRVTVTSEEDVGGSNTLVLAKLATRLRQSGLFSRVISSEASEERTDLELRCRVVDLRKVSQTERALIGALAGRARVGMEVDVVDARTNEKIGGLVAEGKSSGGTAFAGRTAQAAEQLADQVVAYLREHRG